MNFNTSAAAADANAVLGMNDYQRKAAGITYAAAVDPNSPAPAPPNGPITAAPAAGGKSNAGAIAGGVIGGIVLLGLVGFVLHKKSQNSGAGGGTSAANQRFEQTIDYQQLQDAV